MQVVGVERLAGEDFGDTASSAIVFDRQLSVRALRQPPPFVAAPLAASSVRRVVPSWDAFEHAEIADRRRDGSQGGPLLTVPLANPTLAQ